MNKCCIWQGLKLITSVKYKGVVISILRANANLKTLYILSYVQDYNLLTVNRQMCVCVSVLMDGLAGQGRGL